MNNKYYNDISYVKQKIIKYLSDIFKVYGNELLLRIEEYNLLQAENNCIESSTATGFLMEEFIASKLETYTKEHKQKNEIKIQRIPKATINSSFDCYAIYNNIFIMINIKVQKKESANNGISAINILHHDYVETAPNQEKAYLILKTKYSFGKSSTTAERKILIHKIDGYFLEQIDFSLGYKQDHRNWSSNFNGNSGRLQISNQILKNNQLKEEEISYTKTKNFIDKMYNNNFNF